MPEAATSPAATTPVVAPAPVPPPPSGKDAPVVATAADAAPLTPEQVKAGEKAAAFKAHLREQNAKKREAESRRMQAEQIAQQRHNEAQRAAYERDQARREAAQVRAQIEAAGNDPYKILELAGLKPEDVVKRAKEESDPQAQLLKRLEAAEKALAERDKAEKEREERTAREQREAQVAAEIRNSEQHFLTQAKDPSKYPSLSRVRPAALLAEAKTLVEQIHIAARRKGEQPPNLPDHEILGYLEREWSHSFQSSATGNAGAQSSSRPDVSSLSSSAAAGQDSPASGSRTVTNADASQVRTPPKSGPKSRREEKEEMAAEYRRHREAKTRTGG